MARPLEFDKAVALDAAMDQFWREGYEASSIQKLLDVMGINRGSLYASFGDKETLFRAAVKRYESIVDNHTACTLESIEDPIEAIYQFLTERYQHDSRKQLTKGCLLINTLSELAHTEPKLAKLVARKQKAVEKAMSQRLKEARSKGLIRKSTDCDALAGFLQVVMGGLSVRSKQNPDKKELLTIIDTAMKAVA